MTHDEALALIVAAYERAALEADCGCENREATLSAANKAIRWANCGEAFCGAEIAHEIRSLTLPDAKAALDRMIRRAKNEALEKAAERFHTEQLRIYADEILGSLSMDNVLRIETYDEKVLAYQSVAIELAAFPAAIRAMKEPE